MRTSFHHQPEAQHPIFQLSTSWQADYPIFRGQSGHRLEALQCPLMTPRRHRPARLFALQRTPDLMLSYPLRLSLWLGAADAMRSIETSDVHHAHRRSGCVAARGAHAGRPDLSHRCPERQSARITAGDRAVRRVAPQWPVEGRNLVTEGSGIGIPYPRFPDVARELAKAKVEVLVVGGGSPPIRSVQAVAPGIPIIGVAGPVALDGTPPRAPAHALSRPPARSERSAQGDIRGYGSGGEGVRRLTYSRSAWEI